MSGHEKNLSFKVWRSAFAACIAVAAIPSHGAEGFNVRLLGGTIGREVITPTMPGHYGTINLIHYVTDKVKDGNGNDLVNIVSAGPNGSIKIPVAVDFKQSQTTALLRYTYISEIEWLGAKIGATAAAPLLFKDRSLTLTPSFPANAAPPLVSGVRANLAATEALNNQDASGIGDIEIAGIMTWEGERSKISFSPTVILPNGAYDVTKAVNVGQGDYYTFRPAIAWGYVVSDDVQVGVRALWGINTKNKANSYKSGQFVSLEAVAYRRFGNLSLGLNAFVVDQITGDRGGAAPSDGSKLRINGVGLAAAWRALGGAFELKANHEFGGRNARQGMSFIARYSHAF
jgi:hypothetical protein